jgi:hypothetical protein
MWRRMALMMVLFGCRTLTAAPALPAPGAPPVVEARCEGIIDVDMGDAVTPNARLCVFYDSEGRQCYVLLQNIDASGVWCDNNLADVGGFAPSVEM